MSVSTAASVDYLRNLCCTADIPAETSASWITAVSQYNPDIITFIEHLLNTGSLQARKSVILEVANRVGLFNMSRLYGYSGIPLYDQIGDPDLYIYMRCAWTAGNVEQEMPGLALTGTDLSSSIMVLENTFNPTTTNIVRTDDIGYWRGIAVLVLIEHEFMGTTPEQTGAAIRFALLPGGHRNLQWEVDLINERGSFDADLISGLLRQSEGVIGTLQVGLL